MDPTATLQQIRDHVESREYDRAAESFCDLDDWLNHGGFLPQQWQPNHPASGRPRRVQDGDVLDGVVHGRRRSYNLGCKCVPCTAANRLKHNLTPAEMEEYTRA